jgi:hypothetical protein
VAAKDGSANAQYAYSEDIGASEELPPSNVALIPRATTSNGDYSSTSETLTCTFTVDDSRVKNGYIAFYDRYDEMVALSNYFEDDGTISSFLNNGELLDVSGAENTVKITADTGEINYLEQAYGFDDITQFAIVLTNGATISDNRSIFDSGCLSLTDKYIFQEATN